MTEYVDLDRAYLPDPVPAPSPSIRCPTNSRFPEDMVGCGSDNVVGPDAEGLYDCCECGMWFEDEREH